MSEEKKTNWFKTMLSDKEFDWDVSKVFGAICCVCALVGYFMGKENSIALLGEGLALLGIAKIREGI